MLAGCLLVTACVEEGVLAGLLVVGAVVGELGLRVRVDLVEVAGAGASGRAGGRSWAGRAYRRSRGLVLLAAARL